MEIVRYRSKVSGGLNIFHVKSKASATLIKSLLETGSASGFIHSHYHQALLAWNVHDDRSIPDPGKNPYYTEETYNTIKRAVAEGKDVVKMTGKEWYSFVLSSVIEEEEGELIPCKAELMYPLHDWSRTWSLARLSGLSSNSMTFLFQMLHQILPCRERLARILPRVENNICRVCNAGESDSQLHSLSACDGSRETFNWMLAGLNKVCENVTPPRVLLLDFSPSVPLPFHDLPVVWFCAEVLRRIFAYRREEKRCRLYVVRAEMEAEVNMLRRSKYSEMAVVIDTMMD